MLKILQQRKPKLNKHVIDINKSKKQIKIYTKKQKFKMNTLKQKLLGLIFDCFPSSNLFTNQ